MKNPKISRRGVLKGAGALAGGRRILDPRAWPMRRRPEPVTPALIEAAKKEGQVIYYTSIDLPVAEKLAKAFEAKYPGIAVRVERTGAERVFQRIGQEYSSNIHAVDVVNSSDAAHFIVWKRDGILAPYVPEDVAKFYPRRAQGCRRPVRKLARLAQHHRLQHQSGESRRTRRRALPICSIPNGRARSSRRIPATAAPS